MVYISYLLDEQMDVLPALGTSYLTHIIIGHMYVSPPGM